MKNDPATKLRNGAILLLKLIYDWLLAIPQMFAARLDEY